MLEGERVTTDYRQGEIKVDTQIIKCPSCGGNMVFDPSAQKLHCEHCGTIEDVGARVLANEKSILEGFALDKKRNVKEPTVFFCDNCGAKVVLAKDQTATECPFCGTNHVSQTKELIGLKPNAVLPFQLDMESAVNLTKTWAKKKFFAPRAFKKNIKAEKVKGVYTPFFTFDSVTSTIYSARLGKRHTRVVGYGKNRRTETYTVWRTVSGTFNSKFNDVLISAGTKIDQSALHKIMPFSTTSSLRYNEKYLLGFMAYHYDKELEPCWDSAKASMDTQIKADILRGYDYDTVGSFNMSTTHQNVTYKYVMLPVYVGNFAYKSKVYNFYVNGETGKVTGKTPISFWKVFSAILIVLIPTIIMIVLMLLYQNT